MNATGHPTRCRPEYRESADDCAATPPVVFCSFPTLYTGAKELSYPTCRRLGPDTQTQGRVVKLTLTPEVRHMPTPPDNRPKYGQPDAVIARSLFGRAGTGGRLQIGISGRLQIGIGGRLPPESAANSGALCGE